MTETSDFIVIGAGASGASAAAHLAPHGTVQLLEAEFDRRAEAQIPSADDLGSAFEEFLRDQRDD